jgi:hypothetical protein
MGNHATSYGVKIVQGAGDFSLSNYAADSSVEELSEMVARGDINANL